MAQIITLIKFKFSAAKHLESLNLYDLENESSDS